VSSTLGTKEQRLFTLPYLAFNLRGAVAIAASGDESSRPVASNCEEVRGGADAGCGMDWGGGIA
jgi:hypothetical protein